MSSILCSRNYWIVNLYLSKFIIRNKAAYYRLLQEVRTKEAWEDWVLFMLEGIEQTAEETLLLVKKINAVVDKTAEDIKEAFPRIHSRELVDLLFYEFYTKTVYIFQMPASVKQAGSMVMAEIVEGTIFAGGCYPAPG